MKYLISILIFLFIAGAGCKQKEQPAARESAQDNVPIEEGEPDYEKLPPLNFEFTARRSGNEISFKSGSGAEWKEASYSCKELPCKFALNNYGLNSKIPTSVFLVAFTLTADEVGMDSLSMAPRKGSSWETLKYSCKTKTCRFKVDQNGVTGL
ncbi:MAG: hypothetical protein A2179_03285 [Elusimicrobia bacterium GWC2_63_65]|nr:MAG: hypothetical protein A2179_03285 [Elusimicrobia bacterium GWC2_63_65]